MHGLLLLYKDVVMNGNFCSLVKPSFMFSLHVNIFVNCLCGDGGPCNLSGTSLLVTTTSILVFATFLEVCSLQMT
jgi:hypothetical protein